METAATIFILLMVLSHLKEQYLETSSSHASSSMYSRSQSKTMSLGWHGAGGRNLKYISSATISTIQNTSLSGSNRSRSRLPMWAEQHFTENNVAFMRRKPLNVKCDLYSGKWVYDEKYPLWNPMSTLNKNDFSCALLGREDSNYMKLRWQPHQCNLPRFNATAFLNYMKNRRIAFIGDSLALNQFYRLVGMLSEGSNNEEIRVGGSEVIPHPILREWNRNALRAVFYEKYNLSVGVYHAGFIVDTIRNPPNQPPEVKMLLNMSKVSTVYANVLRDLDVAVFNGGHWFGTAHMRLGGKYPWVDGAIDFNMTSEEIFRRALLTLTTWLSDNVRSQQHVFFRSFEPYAMGDRACPALYPQWPFENIRLHPYTFTASDIIQRAKKPILFLNISYLSAVRNDGHVTVNVSRPDCSHWCTPGVPDTWNELMYATILKIENSV